MFGPPEPTLRFTCERDETGTLPALDEDEGEEILYTCEGVTCCIKSEGTLPDDGAGGVAIITSSSAAVAAAADSPGAAVMPPPPPLDDAQLNGNANGHTHSSSDSEGHSDSNSDSHSSPPEQGYSVLQSSMGKLVITSRRVVWLGEAHSAGDGGDAQDGREDSTGWIREESTGREESPDALDFDVPYICLHAVSRDPSTYPLPCIYCQLDAGETLQEAFFAPSDEALLPDMFDAFSRAAELNPDLQEGVEEGDELIFDEEGMMQHMHSLMEGGREGLGIEQQAVLDHLDRVLVFTEGDDGGATGAAGSEVPQEDGQFDDAE